jgi:ribosomal protein S18 acetylase RimI-like enzyme
MYNTPLLQFRPEDFRSANFSDIIHIWRLVYDAYHEYIPILGKTPPTFLEDFDSHVTLGNLWLLDYDHSIDAMVVLTPMIDHILIQTMAVDPKLQGRGLGQILLKFAEYKTLELGLKDIRLYTNHIMTRNIKIYTKWGFEITSIEPYRWGEKVNMRKYINMRKDDLQLTYYLHNL